MFEKIWEPLNVFLIGIDHKAYNRINEFIILGH